MIKRLLLVAAFVPSLAFSQTTDSTKRVDTVKVAALPTIDFSGVLYANYQYRGDRGPSKAQNKFDLERAYLTFKMPAGDRASIRITADVFQQTNSANDAYYKGWVVRAKYAYLQYDLMKSATWNVNLRGGLLPNVLIEHEEGFWPRWISQTAVERSGFFSSSDAGVSSLITFPNKFGELYTTIVNGPGYTSRETDRFKDYAARLSLTPFSYFTLSGWAYQGAVGSSFASVGSSMPRTRSGVFVGFKHPLLTVGAELAQRKDGMERGANTALSPRVESDSVGRLSSAFTVIKPFQAVPLGVVARFDRFRPNTATGAYTNTVIGGLTWDLNKKTSVSVDYQEQTPHGVIAVSPKTYFLHLVANF